MRMNKMKLIYTGDLERLKDFWFEEYRKEDVMI